MENLNDNLFYLLAFACSETRQAFDLYTGISQPRRQLLTLLAQKGELTHAALQQELSLDGATVTRLVKEFETGGLLGRRLDPQNNRFTLVALTKAGKQKISELHSSHLTFQGDLLENISQAEQETVVSVLQRLRENIRKIPVEKENQTVS